MWEQVYNSASPFVAALREDLRRRTLFSTTTKDSSMRSQLAILQRGWRVSSWLRGTRFALVALSVAFITPLSARAATAEGPQPATGAGNPETTVTSNLSQDKIPAIAEPPTQTLAYMVLPEQLEGRAYYRLDDKAACKANNPNHTLIKSWANKLSFHEGRVLEWGMICNDSPKVTPLRDAAVELMVTRDLKKISYRGETLMYGENPPKLCDAGVWCPLKSENQGHE